jgi:hypothetical protein
VTLPKLLAWVLTLKRLPCRPLPPAAPACKLRLFSIAHPSYEGSNTKPDALRTTFRLFAPRPWSFPELHLVVSCRIPDEPPSSLLLPPTPPVILIPASQPQSATSSHRRLFVAALVYLSRLSTIESTSTPDFLCCGAVYEPPRDRQQSTTTFPRVHCRDCAIGAAQHHRCCATQTGYPQAPGGYAQLVFCSPPSPDHELRGLESPQPATVTYASSPTSLEIEATPTAAPEATLVSLLRMQHNPHPELTIFLPVLCISFWHLGF